MVRRSDRVKANSLGFKSSCNKNCLACSVDIPTIHPNALKKTGVELCDMKEDQVDEATLMGKGKLEPVRKRQKSSVTRRGSPWMRGAKARSKMTYSGPRMVDEVLWIMARSRMTIRVSTKASRQSTLGYTHGSSLSVDGAQATDLMVTQDTDKVFIQVRPPCGRNTYVLRLIVLDCVEIICLGGSLAPPYIVRRAGLQIWKLILVGYNCHR